MQGAGNQGTRGAACYEQCGHRLCHGLLGATSDVDQLISWAEQFPQANIGLRTGRASNVFTLDVDGPEGERRLTELEAEHSPLPNTRKHHTGGGTWHYLFNYPNHRRNPAHRDGEWRNNARSRH